MKKFKDFGIQLESKNFVGSKIGIEDLLEDKSEITIIDYKIGDSKYEDKGNGKCLSIQLEFKGEKRVLFSGSGVLMETLEKIPKDGFPFGTVIIKKNRRLELT